MPATTPAPTPPTPALTRRDWLARAAAPMLAATFAYPLLAGAAAPQSKIENRESKIPSPAAAAIHDIRAYGAIAGGSAAVNTTAIQSAIDAAHAAGGGTVLIPAGVFLCGSIELKSNVTLHLAPQATLLGSPRPADYHAGRALPSGNGNMVFISAADADNITIEGAGAIDGNGLAFYTGQGDNTGPGQNSAKGYTQRPHLLIFARCKNLRIQDTFLSASAYHCLRVLDCEYVWFERVRIHNRVNKNNDGFHFVSSRHVHVNACDVRCQDDACALFGSNKNVTISNSTFSTRWSIFRFGGGECENILVTNCLIYETYGCPIKMSCRANSRFENMLFSNLVLRDVTGPISISLSSAPRHPAPAASAAPDPALAQSKIENRKSKIPRGIVRNISFENIRGNVVAHGRQYPDMHWEQGYRPGEDRTCITLNAVEGDLLENISFSNIHLTFEGGGTLAEAQRDIPQIAGEYFEIGDRPAYGLYARNVRTLTLDNVRLETATPDLRPAVVLDNITDATLSTLATQGNPSAPSTLRLINTTDTLIAAPRLLTPAAVYLAVEGERSANITLLPGDTRKAATQVTHTRGATPKSTHLPIQ